MRTTAARRGHPDRSNSGPARRLDRRRETRNRLREQHGYDFDRIVLPVGPETDRPVAPVEGEFRRNTTLGGWEGYDGATWEELTPAALITDASEEVDFSATTRYTHVHARSVRPDVTVLDSTGAVVETCVQHTDSATVVVSFIGTLTGAKLLLT